MPGWNHSEACSALRPAFERVDDKTAVMRLDGDDDRCGVARPPRVRNQDRSVIAKDDGHCADLVVPVHPEWRLGPGEALARSVVVATVETQNAGDTAWPVGAVSKWPATVGAARYHTPISTAATTTSGPIRRTLRA